MADPTPSVDYDPTTGAYHARHDTGGGDSLCLAVVEAVSAAAGRDLNDMEPLYSVVDTDALDSLVSTTRGADVDVSFTYEGCTVSITSAGDIAACHGKPREEESPFLKECDRCEATLGQGVRYPTVTQTDDDGRLQIYTFCDAGCKSEWHGSDHGE